MFFAIIIFYRDREAKAERVAREIEGTSASHLAAELENGDDNEEDAFSAVQRGTPQSKLMKKIGRLSRGITNVY